jgi:hypothetical protein
LPEASALVVAVFAPLSWITAPDPAEAGDSVPVIVQVWDELAVKFTAVIFELATVTVCCVGLNVVAVLEGVTVYVPFASPLSV